MATQQTRDSHDNREMPGEQNSRLVLDITPSLRRRIERAAARGDLSAAEYAKRMLEQNVPEEEEEEQEAKETTRGQPVTAEYVEELRRSQEEWSRNHPGVVLEDSVELIRRMRGWSD